MHPKEFFDSTEVKQKNAKCFVIMPFGDEFKSVYGTVREAIEDKSLDFVCERADDINRGRKVELPGIEEEVLPRMTPPVAIVRWLISQSRLNTRLSSSGVRSLHGNFLVHERQSSCRNR